MGIGLLSGLYAFPMRTVPASEQISDVSPLRGFDFTSSWIRGDRAAREILPAMEEMLDARLSQIGGDRGPGAWAPWSESEVAELVEFNHALGNSGGASLAPRLGSGDCLTVVTGQQPDLLASPLYVLYKALSAIAWAKALSERTGRPVTPVFWIASDDDDFAELKHAWMVSWAGELRDVGGKISRGRGVGAGTPAFQWELSESAERLQGELSDTLSDWPDGQQVIQRLREQLADSPNFEAFFGRLLAGLLGEQHQMVFVAPRLKGLRRRAAAVLKRDIDAHAGLNAAITGAAATAEAAGFPISLARDPAAMNFFWLREGRRCRLVQTSAGGSIQIVDPASKRPPEEISPAELRVRLEEAPEEFIPNVVTRPVVQDLALPNLLYVAGPGELAYLALLWAAYETFATGRAALTPRAFVQMALPEAADDGAASGNDEVLEQVDQVGPALLEQVSALAQRVTDGLGQMRSTAGGTRHEVQQAIDKTEQHILRGLEQLKGRLARQVAPEIWQKAARRGALVTPSGAPQERILAPWNFVKPDDWGALAAYVAGAADLTQAGPHTICLPPWMRDII